MKTNIVIRADGGRSIGVGHIVRCLALADMLKNNFTITFAIQEPPVNVLTLISKVTPHVISLPLTTNYEADANNFVKHLQSKDIVLIDGYNFKSDYQQKIKLQGCKLVAIDDLHAWHHTADAVINHSAGMNKNTYSVESYTKCCFGLDYVLLRKEFLTTNDTPLRKIIAVKKVFISMGAADAGNLTQKFTEALLQLDEIDEIHLMLSYINPNLKSIETLIAQSPAKIKSHFDITASELKALLSACDISICPASTISLESCAVGIGLISGHTAANQLSNLKGMEALKILLNFGNMNTIDANEIKIKMKSLIQHPETLNALIENQRKMIDGKSPERLLNVFKSL